jgi:hypothetical protein
MRSADLIRAKANDARPAKDWAEGIKPALPYVAKFDQIRLGEAKRVPSPHQVGIKPRAPDDHVIGLSGGIFVELRQTLSAMTPSKARLRP